MASSKMFCARRTFYTLQKRANASVARPEPCRAAHVPGAGHAPAHRAPLRGHHVLKLCPLSLLPIQC
jgi:hypothetical protein